MFALRHLALLRVEGRDAATFLGGQCCNTLPDSEGVALNAWCNAAGRVIATFILIRRDQCFDLLLPGGLAGAVARRLGMFVLRAALEIRDASAEHLLLGMAKQEACELLERAAGEAELPAPGRVWCKAGMLGFAVPYARERYVFLVEKVSALGDAAGLLEDAAGLGAARHWQFLELAAGMPWLHAASSEQFFPQQLNLDLLQGMSLQKGCYPGQEIIARLHYRGKVGQRLLLATPDGDGASLAAECCEPLRRPGQERTAGRALACLADDAGRPHLQAVLDTECLGRDDVFPVSCPTLRLRVYPPPYYHP